MTEQPPHTVCHLFMSSEFGGLEKHVMELAAWQAEYQGVRVAIIAHPRYQSQCPGGVQFIPLDTDRSRRHPMLLVGLAGVCRRREFDVLHGHGGKAASVMAMLRRWIPGRMVITRHNIAHPKDRIATYFSRRIAVSRKAVANSGLEWNVIPNGTHTPDARLARPKGCEPGVRVVLAVARLVPAKGLDVLLRAWSQLQPENARLYLVGDGPDRQKLESLAQDLELADSVRFVGYSSEVDAWMQAAEFMVVSSRKEGAPYTVVEALLNRCPVVSTDVGSNREMLPQAYIAEDVSVDCIAALLDQSLSDPEALQQAYAPVFQYAQDQLTVSAMARATWSVYQASAE